MTKKTFLHVVIINYSILVSLKGMEAQGNHHFLKNHNTNLFANALNKKGETPLHLAVIGSKSDLQKDFDNDQMIIGMLFIKGANPFIENYEKQTPQQFALKSNRLKIAQLFKTYEKVYEKEYAPFNCEGAEKNLLNNNQ